jgi:hypothetical protein
MEVNASISFPVFPVGLPAIENYRKRLLFRSHGLFAVSSVGRHLIVKRGIQSNSIPHANRKMRSLSSSNWVAMKQIAAWNPGK